MGGCAEVAGEPRTIEGFDDVFGGSNGQQEANADLEDCCRAVRCSTMTATRAHPHWCRVQGIAVCVRTTSLVSSWSRVPPIIRAGHTGIKGFEAADKGRTRDVG